MSDVLWAAIIAVGGSALTGLIAYRAAIAQSAATVQTAKSLAEVELAKVQAELERLRRQHREDERRNRQGTYHRLLAVLDRFDTMGTGYAPSDAQFNETLAEFNNLHGAIHLFGAEDVRDAMGPVTEGFDAVGESMAATRDMPPAESFPPAYGEHRARILTATAALTEAMRGDVTRGLLSDD